MTALVVLWGLTLVWHRFKPLPEGVGVVWPTHQADVEFLFDLTYLRADTTVVEQEIFDRVLAMIDEAERFVVIDMFLFNDEHGGERDYRPLTAQLTERLLARKRAQPNIDITFITDEINNFYGAYTTPQIASLREHGVSVITTNLRRLRDPNPMYSAGWRMGVQWFGTRGNGAFPHPLSSTGRQVTARSYLRLLNFKANHRKLIVTEDGCMVMSANPHDASGFHSNVAFATRGALCADVVESERGIASFSGGSIDVGEGALLSGGAVRAQFVTEGRIRDGLLADIDATRPGDAIDMAVFYLSERNIIEALKRAAIRGVNVRIVLDPNKDAFGREKGGVPNRQVAWELLTQTSNAVDVRWYDTHGEQFHTKLTVFATADSVAIYGGSANLTRRNIGDYNLEANLRVVGSPETPLVREVRSYFERIWSNEDGHYTLDFTAYYDDGWLKRILYRFQEFTGLSSF